MKKIIYNEPPDQHLPQLCEICGNEVIEGECYWDGQGVYLCSEECVKRWE